MEPLHFITKLLDIKDPNIQIMDIVNRDTHKEIIAKLDYEAPSCSDCWKQMKNMTFKKLLRFLTLKRLVCLLKFSWKSVVSNAISAQKWWSLKLLSSRRITKFPVSLTKRLLKSWLKRLLWPTLPINFPSQLQLLFASSMTFTLSMVFLVYQRLCLGTLRQSGEWLFQSGDEDEFHCERFW